MKSRRWKSLPSKEKPSAYARKAASSSLKELLTDKIGELGSSLVPEGGVFHDLVEELISDFADVCLSKIDHGLKLDNKSTSQELVQEIKEQFPKPSAALYIRSVGINIRSIPDDQEILIDMAQEEKIFVEKQKVEIEERGLPDGLESKMIKELKASEELVREVK